MKTLSNSLLCSLFLNLFDNRKTLSLISFYSNSTITEIGLLIEPLPICLLVVIFLSFFILNDPSILPKTLSNFSTSSCTRAFSSELPESFTPLITKFLATLSFCVWSVRTAFINAAFTADSGFATFVSHESKGI